MLYLRWPAWPYYKVPPPTLPPDILLKAEVTADVHEFVDSNITSPDPPQGCLNNEYHCTYGGWAETNVDIKIFMINVLYVVMLGLIRGYKKYIYYIYLFIYLWYLQMKMMRWGDYIKEYGWIIRKRRNDMCVTYKLKMENHWFKSESDFHTRTPFNLKV